MQSIFSQDGRGLGLFLSIKITLSLNQDAKLPFRSLLTKKHYLFYAGVKNVKKSKGDVPGTSMGVRIYSCDQPEGIGLMASYATPVDYQEYKLERRSILISRVV